MVARDKSFRARTMDGDSGDHSHTQWIRGSYTQLGEMMIGYVGWLVVVLVVVMGMVERRET